MVINPNEDFYELNPELEFRQPWKSIKEDFPENPSQMCWVLFMLCDRRSDFYNEYTKVRKKLIATDYIEDEEFDYEILSEYIKDYDKNVIVNRYERDIKVLEDKIESRIIFIAESDYNTKTLKTIDSAILATPTLYETIEKLKSSLIKKNKDSQKRGGGEESLSEKGII